MLCVTDRLPGGRQPPDPRAPYRRASASPSALPPLEVAPTARAPDAALDPAELDPAARAAHRCSEAISRGEQLVLVPDGLGFEPQSSYDRVYEDCVDPLIEYDATRRHAAAAEAGARPPEPGPADGGRKARVARRARPAPPLDRNLVTVAEFAAALDVAQSTVFELLKRGLPAVKTTGLGRRILRQQAEAWLVGGGAERSRAAKRLAKARAAVGGPPPAGPTTDLDRSGTDGTRRG